MALNRFKANKRVNYKKKRTWPPVEGPFTLKPGVTLRGALDQEFDQEFELEFACIHPETNEVRLERPREFRRTEEEGV